MEVTEGEGGGGGGGGARRGETMTIINNNVYGRKLSTNLNFCV